MHGPDVAKLWFLAQGSLGIGWWGLLWLRPDSRAWFAVPADPPHALLSFWLADLVLYVGGSLATAFALWAGSARAVPLAWLTAGAAGYAALYCIGLSLWTGGAWLSAGLMAASALGTLVAAQCAGRGAQPR